MKTNKVDTKLVKKMAKSVADQINYVGLEAPSEAAWSRMDEIISSFMLNDRARKTLQNKVDKMTYKDAMKLEQEVNYLLETRDYD